jgi:hypothetical protein
MKAAKERYYGRIHKQRRIHPDDPWTEIKLAKTFKQKRRSKISKGEKV